MTQPDGKQFAPLTGEVATGEVATGEVATGEVATGEVATGEVATGEVATGEVATGEVATGEVATGEVATGEVATGEVATGEVVAIESRVDESLAIVTRALPATFAQAFADFLDIDVADGDATEDTVRTYLTSVASFLKWCADENLAPAAARRADIERYRADLKLAGNAVATRARKLSIVRRFYEAALKHGLVRDNPALRVRGGKDLTPPEEKIKALTRGALIDLLASIPTGNLPGARDRAIIALMAVHGLRRIEVHRLDHAHIESGGEATALVVHGKGNRLRRVFLRDDTLAAVLAYVEAKSQRGLPLEGALFLSQSNRTGGKRLSRRGLNFVVDRYLDPLGLKRAGVSCHSLRHTHGTLAVSGGAKIEQLRDAMGHSKIETTSIYIRAVERIKNNPANFIDVEV